MQSRDISHSSGDIASYIYIYRYTYIYIYIYIISMTFYPVVNGGSDKKSGARGIHIPHKYVQTFPINNGEVPNHLVAVW